MRVVFVAYCLLHAAIMKHIEPKYEVFWIAL